MNAVQEFNMNGNGTNGFSWDGFKDVLADARPAVNADSVEAQPEQPKNDGVSMQDNVTMDMGLSMIFGMPMTGFGAGALVDAADERGYQMGLNQQNAMAAAPQTARMRTEIGPQYSNTVTSMRPFDLKSKNAKFSMLTPYVPTRLPSHEMVTVPSPVPQHNYMSPPKLAMGMR